MPLAGGGLLQPYADVQYVDRIVRKKIKPPKKVEYGSVKPRVYYTCVESTDHTERELVALVVRRSALLETITAMKVAERERRPWSKVEGLRTLIALRSLTLTIVAAVRSWRVSVGERAFLHRGENYLLLLRDDMRDLELLDPPIQFGFEIGRRNPFCLPLVTHRAPPAIGGKRLLKSDGETIARSLATVSPDERAQILVEHEYLQREEKRDLRKQGQVDRGRPWAFDRWDHGKAWAPQPPVVSSSMILRRARAPALRGAFAERRTRELEAEEVRARRDAASARQFADATAVARARSPGTLRGARRGKTGLEPLDFDDQSAVSFDESVGTFAGGKALDALESSPGANSMRTFRTLDRSLDDELSR